jgi:tRNA(Ile)-lysidine synthetase-like protein
MTTLLYKAILPKNATIIVAVSGGVDSMVLLHQLIQIRETERLRLVVCHVDHGKRAESKEEYHFVETYCADHDILFRGLRLSKLPKGNFQEAARDARYRFFAETAREERAEAIVLAHHLDDQAETVLMRLFRGSTLLGQAGMQEISVQNGIRVLRPLLSRTKQEILEYQRLHQVPYREDASNQSGDYTRNKVRHDLVPMIDSLFPSWKETIRSHAAQIREAALFVDGNAARFLEEAVRFEPSNASFDLASFQTLDPAVRRAVLIKSWRRLTNDASDLSVRHQDAMLRLVDSPRPNLRHRLTDGWSFVKSYHILAFEHGNESTPDYVRILPESGHLDLPNGETVFIGECGNIPDGIQATLCYNDGNRFFPLTARTRRPGDRLDFPFGTKKLKDWLIDKKVPIAKRDSLLLIVAADGEILWIPELQWLKRNDGEHSVTLTVRKG